MFLWSSLQLFMLPCILFSLFSLKVSVYK